MQPMSHRSHQGFLLEDWRVPSRQVYDQATFLPGTPSMSRPMRRLLCAGLLLLIPGLSLAADNAAAAGPQPPVTDRSLAESTCVIGEEAFVPGDYYYCLAGQSYGEKNYGQSRRFFTTAAGWASKPAQFMLGLMAFNGDQQAVNRPLGLAWLALAAERGQPRFSSALAAARSRASAADWAAAQATLAQLQPTYGDAKAAPRAEEPYRLGMQQLLTPWGMLRGHTFHYSKLQSEAQEVARSSRPGQAAESGKGEAVYQQGSIHASYFHAWFPSCPQAVAALLGVDMPVVDPQAWRCEALNA